MKRYLLYLFSLIITGPALAQSELAADQNPNYALSLAKYQQVADSVNRWHSTTIQDTYKAIDFMADREAVKHEHRAFRRELRTIRAGRANRSYYDPYAYHIPRYSRYHYQAPYRYRNNYPVLPWMIPGIWFR